MDQTSSTLSDKEFSHATSLLQQLLGSRSIVEQLEQDGSANAQQVYTNAATLFALILQRLAGGLTLTQTVKRMIDEHRDLLRQGNKRVNEDTLSQNASAYSKARQSLPLAKVATFCQLLCDHIARQCDHKLDGRPIYIVDGTTISLPPTKELAENFPPASNQHGKTPWPIVNMLVAHEMHSSCCLVPEIGAMYGSNNAGEIKLFKRMVAERIPSGSIIMADSGFGVFSAAYHSQLNDQRFIFALTAQRFHSHVKRAACVDQGDGFKSYEYLWNPSPKERRKHPEIPEDAELRVWIHQIELDNGKMIQVVSDLPYDAWTMAELYRHRYDGEFDIRDVKVTMDVENMRARQYDTIMKELYGSVMAYNLVVQFRRSAAKLRGISPRRLSFSDTWLDFQHGLLRKTAADLDQWQELYQKALVCASKRLLPDRRGKRTYPRVSYQKRTKATKFESTNRVEAKQIREANRRKAHE